MAMVFSRRGALVLLLLPLACGSGGEGTPFDTPSSEGRRDAAHSRETHAIPPSSPPSTTSPHPATQGDGATLGQAPGRPTLAPLVERVQPTVVGVTARRDVSQKVPEEWRRFFGERMPGPPEWHEEQVGTGSGVVISSDGYVLTNHHVVAGAEEIRVQTADEEAYEADLVGSDPETDLALLRLRDLQEPLVAASLGNSDDLRVGDFVLAIGHPFGLELTVTSGIISAKSRVIGLGPYDEFLQTDAAINPGNSGGPLFDLQGNVVGITTAILARGQGIGFAIPVDLIQALLPQLRENGRVVRGFLGVAAQDVTEDLATAFDLEAEDGALISSAEEGTPAHSAGLLPGDVVVSVDEESVDGASDLSRRVASRRPGDAITIEYLRDGERRTTRVTLAERPPTPGMERWQNDDGERRDGRGDRQDDDAGLGVRAQTLPPEAREEFGVEGGALIVGVQPGSRAHQVGLMPGDVVVEANRRPVNDSRGLARAVEASKGETLLLRVFREGQGIFVAVPGE